MPEEKRPVPVTDDDEAQTPTATPEELLAEQDPADPEVGVDGTGSGALP
jgi:hypothetical protein